MATATTPEKVLFYTTWEAADFLKISEKSVRAAIAKGEIRVTKLCDRIVRIPAAEIDRLGHRHDPDCADGNGRQKTAENNGTSAI